MYSQICCGVVHKYIAGLQQAFLAHCVMCLAAARGGACKLAYQF